MSTAVDTRIEDRDRVAGQMEAAQNPLQRTVSETGRGAANAIDRTDDLFASDKSVFLGNTALGALRGAFLGGLVAIGGMVAVSLLLPALAVSAAMAPVVAGLFMVAGAAIAAVHDGQSALEERQNDTSKRLSDRIAEKTGAAPKQEMLFTRTPEETLLTNGRDPMLEAKVQASLARAERIDKAAAAGTTPATTSATAPMSVNAPASFAGREDQRRANVPAQGRGA